jgi:hypothetical protein
MSVALCRHIKTNGTRCQSPALTGELWCYFHHRLHQRHAGFRRNSSNVDYRLPGPHIELAPLEDRESIQLALSVVINALATGQLEIPRATALLYGLQIASSNAGRLQLKPFAPNVVRQVEPSPEGLDLAQPGALLEEDLYNDFLKEVDDDEEEDDDQDREEDEEQCIDDLPEQEGVDASSIRSITASGCDEPIHACHARPGRVSNERFAVSRSRPLHCECRRPVEPRRRSSGSHTRSDR